MKWIAPNLHYFGREATRSPEHRLGRRLTRLSSILPCVCEQQLRKTTAAFNRNPHLPKQASELPESAMEKFL
jgi:hypothetical protein